MGSGLDCRRLQKDLESDSQEAKAMGSKKAEEWVSD
jgi:hypothetical protein